MSILLSKARRAVAVAASPLASSSATVVAPRLLGLGGAAPRAARAFATIFTEDDKAFTVANLLEAKRKSKLTFTEIAERTGLTNAYVAQLFYRQAHLKKETAAALKAAVPALTKDDLEAMQEIPFRSYHRDIIRTEPLIYRLEEAMLHYGQGIKAIINENFGDGIMSAIDVYVNVDKVKGKLGEDRVQIVLNGKFLPHIEQGVDGGSAPAKGKTTKAKKSAAAASSSGDGLVKRTRAAKKPKATAAGGATSGSVGLMSSLSTLAAAAAAAPAEAGAAKRGRGRPRKQQQQQQLLLPSLGLSTAAVGSGLSSVQQEGEVLQAAPTRLLVGVGAEEGVVKRGRGRPAGSKNKAAAQIWV